jgi:GNAT superfamily N-acetyltransferase
VLFHIEQSHAPRDCPYGKGGSTSLFDRESTDVKILGYWLAFPQHTTYLVVEAGRRRHDVHDHAGQRQARPGPRLAGDPPGSVADGIRIAPVTADELPAVLPLIALYQVFYEVEPDEERNRAYFARFLEPSDHGLLLAAWVGREPVGFTCLYFTGSSTLARDVVLLSDLLVVAGHRGRGVGAALIDAALDVARIRGAAHVEWLTAIDNRRAQRLYERVPGAERSAWFGYEVPVDPPDQAAT